MLGKLKGLFKKDSSNEEVIRNLDYDIIVYLEHNADIVKLDSIVNDFNKIKFLRGKLTSPVFEFQTAVNDFVKDFNELTEKFFNDLIERQIKLGASKEQANEEVKGLIKLSTVGMFLDDFDDSIDYAELVKALDINEEAIKQVKVCLTNSTGPNDFLSTLSYLLEMFEEFERSFRGYVLAVKKKI